VNNTNADVITIDILKDVNLSARGPQSSCPVRLAHHPEGGPDALLLGPGGTADAQLAFDTGDLAGSRGERVLALDATARPATDGRAVLLREELKTAFSGVLSSQIKLVFKINSMQESLGRFDRVDLHSPRDRVVDLFAGRNKVPRKKRERTLTLAGLLV
jgi:hypothetical protein